MKQQNNKRHKLISISSRLFFAISLLVSFSVKGQYLSTVVMGSGGETFSDDTYSLDFSVGEISVESYQTQAVFLSQGFLQGTEESTGVEELQKKKVHLKIYPNPVSQTLNLVYQSELKPTNCIISGIMGESITSLQIDPASHSINVSNLKPGSYLLKLHFSDQSSSIQTFIKY